MYVRIVIRKVCEQYKSKWSLINNSLERSKLVYDIVSDGKKSLDRKTIRLL